LFGDARQTVRSKRAKEDAREDPDRVLYRDSERMPVAIDSGRTGGRSGASGVPDDRETGNGSQERSHQPSGKEGTVLRVELPGGWVGDWHYQGRKQFGPGEVYHEAVNTTMQARNPSSGEHTTLILFQIGGKDEPLMLLAQPPRR
jgi:hypothetical protein